MPLFMSMCFDFMLFELTVRENWKGSLLKKKTHIWHEI